MRSGEGKEVGLVVRIGVGVDEICGRGVAVTEDEDGGKGTASTVVVVVVVEEVEDELDGDTTFGATS